MKFDLEELTSNPNARVIIALDNVRANKRSNEAKRLSNKPSLPGVGWMEGNRQIGGGNEFSTPLDVSIQNEKLNRIIKVVKAVGGIQPKLFVQTTKTWESSQTPNFTINMTFVAIRKDDDVRVPVRSLLSTVYPVGTYGFMSAPLGYKLGAIEALKKLVSGQGKKAAAQVVTPVGTIFCEIGRWFRAPNQVARSVDFTFSKEVHSNGTPLYASGSISFEPFRAISFDEIDQYIRV